MAHGHFATAQKQRLEFLSPHQPLSSRGRLLKISDFESPALTTELQDRQEDVLKHPYTVLERCAGEAAAAWTETMIVDCLDREVTVRNLEPAVRQDGLLWKAQKRTL